MHEMFMQLIAWYQHSLDKGGYWLVALLMAIESSVVPLPSELVIPFAAHLAHTQGKMTVTGVVIAGALGSWVGATVMYWASRQVQSLWDTKEIYISENGCGASDVISQDGTVDDSDRIMFLRNHLDQLQRATAHGIRVKGYFHWSLMDNFEWTSGFGTRFGLVYVDYKTQERIPKLSATYFRESATRNAVL